MDRQKVLLEEMSWPEVQEALKRGMKTVIIVAASVEQHGPHMAEITDTVLGYESAIDLARRLGDALVAPVIRPGLSEHHMPLPGSLTLRPEVFTGIVEDYVAAYVAHGFEKIVLASSHGGNFKTLERIVAELSERYPQVRIVGGFSLADMMEVVENMEREEGLPEGSCGGHACAWETSEMLLFAPRLVDMNRATCGHVGKVTDDVLKRFFERGVLAVSETGIMGDARHATADRGQRFFRALQDRLETVVRERLAK